MVREAPNRSTCADDIGFLTTYSGRSSTTGLLLQKTFFGLSSVLATGDPFLPLLKTLGPFCEDGGFLKIPTIPRSNRCRLHVVWDGRHPYMRSQRQQWLALRAA